jgi:hypothetical protein
LRWQRLEPFSKAGPNAARTPRRDPELLPGQGSHGSGGSGEWQHQGFDPPRARLQDLDYLLLKARYMAATKSESVVLEKAA